MGGEWVQVFVFVRGSPRFGGEVDRGRHGIFSGGWPGRVSIVLIVHCFIWVGKPEDKVGLGFKRVRLCDLSHTNAGARHISQWARWYLVRGAAGSLWACHLRSERKEVQGEEHFSRIGCVASKNLSATDRMASARVGHTSGQRGRCGTEGTAQGQQ